VNFKSLQGAQRDASHLLHIVGLHIGKLRSWCVQLGLGFCAFMSCYRLMHTALLLKQALHARNVVPLPWWLLWRNSNSTTSSSGLPLELKLAWTAVMRILIHAFTLGGVSKFVFAQLLYTTKYFIIEDYQQGARRKYCAFQHSTPSETRLSSLNHPQNNIF
jgi:hypothetical protein